jgi:hypothetical protein
MRDTLEKLRTERDVWVATADEDGTPYLVPLSLAWDGHAIVLSAETRSRTIQSLLRTRIARLGLGPTRDVVMIDAVVTASWSVGEVPEDVASTYAERAGWDPRMASSGQYSYVQLEPRRIQAWREANELAGRTLMRDGAWLDSSLVGGLPAEAGPDR